MESGGFHGYRQHLPNASPAAGPGLKLTETNMMRLASSSAHEINQPNNINHTNYEDNECIVREQDRFMPIANVIRIMRKILPQHAKISDDAKETIQECVSEYISFITGEANERCQREQRKTITAEDVLWAMSKLGFDDYIEPLTIYLHRYREMEGERGSIRGDPPLVKRPPVEFRALGVAAFAAPAAAFHRMGLGHGHGFFGAATAAAAMGTHFNNNGPSNNNIAAGSSRPAVVNGETYAPNK